MDSDRVLVTAQERLAGIFKETRKWMFTSMSTVFRVLTNSTDSLAVFFVPISKELEVPAEQRQLRFISFEFRIRTISSILTQMFGEIPEEILHFLKYYVSNGACIPGEFLLPFENRAIDF